MKFSKTKDVKTPSRGTSASAGIDFYIPNDVEWESINVFPNQSIKIESGIKVSIPKGYALIGFNKSGVALKGLQLGACLIDEDFQGEISIHLFNVSTNLVTLKRGQKIVQFVLLKINYDNFEEVPLIELYDAVSERAEGAFGSTDNK